jgi:hypothetical protein
VLKAQVLAEQEKVDIRLYSIIYDAISDIKKAMEGLLEPTYKEHVLGRAQVIQVFNVRWQVFAGRIVRILFQSMQRFAAVKGLYTWYRRSILHHEDTTCSAKPDSHS